MLPVVDGPAPGVDAPIDPAVFCVKERGTQVVVSAAGHLLIRGVAVSPVGCREGPEDTSVEDGRPFDIIAHGQVIVDPAVEPAGLPVDHVLHPERQDVAPQLCFDAYAEIIAYAELTHI